MVPRIAKQLCRGLIGALVAVPSVFALQADASITRIVVDERQSPAYDGRSFGEVGQYERLTGHTFGELDPKDPHNKIINDIELAPRNQRGKVEYVATFTLLKPLNNAKASGILMYSVPNRGNRIMMPAFNVGGDPGDGFFYKRGDIVLYSGWQGDLPARPGTETIRVPVARNADGSSITGPAFARFSNMTPRSASLALPAGQPSEAFDHALANLTRRTSEDGEVIPVGLADWAFSDSRPVPFPGTPDTSWISLKGGFDPACVYELSYTTKDPPVLGVGLAATRDIVSFFRYTDQDASGAANPIKGKVTHVIGQGISQSGNFVKSFIHLGFNQDENGRMVWDGANPHIAGRQLPINFRFARPGGAASLYEPGSEAVLWWGQYTDVTRGRKPSSLLDRSRATNSVPKIFETFGSAEFWGLRMSPNLVGTAADRDIPLPENVRRYYFPGTTHGGGRGGFSATARAGGQFELADNPNPQLETMRALMTALIDWVVKDTPPPASQYPLLAQGQLVPPDHRSMGFPMIPGSPMPDNLINPFLDYDLGPQFIYDDLGGQIAAQPPRIKQVLPSLVPRENADGNEVSGVASVLHRAPLGTYLGWNVTRTGFYNGHAAGFSGGFIPFARTKADRDTSGDPRPSLEERYHDHAGYVATVREAAADLIRQRFLTREDAERLVHEAEASDVLK